MKAKLSRISISLPEELLVQFDELVVASQYESRSKAITDVLQKSIVEHSETKDDAIMAGTINLVFDDSIPLLRDQLAQIQRKYINEVISNLNVNLENNKTMTVILVQGPVATLHTIADELKSRKGVTIGKLLLSTAILPPVHPLPNTSN